MAFDLTEFSRGVIDILMAVGPFVSAAVVGFLVGLAMSATGRTRLLLAHRGLQEVRGGRWRLWLAGTMLPLLAMSALNAALAIEAEIRSGPNRMLDTVQSMAPDSATGTTYWVLERGTGHFMNTSRVEADAVDSRSHGIEAVAPFWADLTNIRRGDGSDQTGLVLGGPLLSGAVVSPPVRAGATCELQRGRCVLRAGEAIVDQGDGYALGEELSIQDEVVRVVGFFQQPPSLLNRSVVFTSTDHASEPPFGLLVVATDFDALHLAIDGSGSPVDVLSIDDLRRGNTTFWAGNGTPILTMLVVLIAVFGAASIFATRRSEHEATRDVRWTIRALGLTRGEGRQLDLARSLLTVVLAAAPAAAISAVLVAALNTAVLGFHASVSVSTSLAAMGLTAMAAGSAGVLSRGGH